MPLAASAKDIAEIRSILGNYKMTLGQANPLVSLAIKAVPTHCISWLEMYARSLGILGSGGCFTFL